MNPLLHRILLVLVCAPFLQGGLVKTFDFSGAVGEMTHFGLQPAAVFAVLVIVLELVASAMVIADRGRAPAALALAVFTVAATFMANRFWTLDGMERFHATNAFFEHFSIVGGLLLAAFVPLRRDTR